MARKRPQITITLPRELVYWLDKKIEDLTFYGYSHAVEKALRELKERIENDD